MSGEIFSASHHTWSRTFLRSHIRSIIHPAPDRSSLVDANWPGFVSDADVVRDVDSIRSLRIRVFRNWMKTTRGRDASDAARRDFATRVCAVTNTESLFDSLSDVMPFASLPIQSPDFQSTGLATKRAKSITNLLNELSSVKSKESSDSRHLVIWGKPGAGKTVSLLGLFFDCLKSRDDSPDYLPCWVSCAAIASATSLWKKLSACRFPQRLHFSDSPETGTPQAKLCIAVATGLLKESDDVPTIRETLFNVEIFLRYSPPLLFLFDLQDSVQLEWLSREILTLNSDFSHRFIIACPLLGKSCELQTISEWRRDHLWHFVLQDIDQQSALNCFETIRKYECRVFEDLESEFDPDEYRNLDVWRDSPFICSSGPFNQRVYHVDADVWELRVRKEKELFEDLLVRSSDEAFVQLTPFQLNHLSTLPVESIRSADNVQTLRQPIYSVEPKGSVVKVSQETSSPIVTSDDELTLPVWGWRRAALEWFFPRLHTSLMDRNSWSQPVELDAVRNYIARLRAKLEHDLRHKTYIPVSAVPLESTNTPTVAPNPRSIGRRLRVLSGLAAGGDGASAEIAGLSQKSRVVRNLVKLLRQTEDPLVLLGDPGTGKTLTLQMALLEVLRSEENRVLPKVPVFIHLGNVDPESRLTASDVFEYVAQAMCMGEEDKSTRRLLRAAIPLLVSRRRLVLIFDGMDEMPRHAYAAQTEALSRFAAERRVKTLSSCRINDFNHQFSHKRLVLMPFVEKQVADFVHSHLTIYPMVISGETYSRRQLVKKLLTSELPVDVRNPYTLHLLCEYLRDRKAWPDSRVELLDFYCQRLAGLHANGRASIDEDSLLNNLADIAFHLTMRNSQTSIPVGDLIERLNTSPRNGYQIIDSAIRSGLLFQSLDQGRRVVRFPHHRLQEYFCSKAVAKGQSLDWSERVDSPRWQETIINVLLVKEERGILRQLTAMLDEDLKLCQQLPAEYDTWNEDDDIEDEFPFDDDFPFEDEFEVDPAAAQHERRLADRVEFASRLVHQIGTGIQQQHPELISTLQRAAIFLATRGTPISQVKMLKVCHNAPTLNRFRILSHPVQSPVNWVRDQALLLLGTTSERGSHHDTDLASHLSLDLCRGSVSHRIPVYFRAAWSGRRKSDLWPCALAAAVVVLRMLIVVSFSIAVWEKTAKIRLSGLGDSDVASVSYLFAPHTLGDLTQHWCFALVFFAWVACILYHEIRVHPGMAWARTMGWALAGLAVCWIVRVAWIVGFSDTLLGSAFGAGLFAGLLWVLYGVVYIVWDTILMLGFLAVTSLNRTSRIQPRILLSAAYQSNGTSKLLGTVLITVGGIVGLAIVGFAFAGILWALDHLWEHYLNSWVTDISEWSHLPFHILANAVIVLCGAAFSLFSCFSLLLLIGERTRLIAKEKELAASTFFLNAGPLLVGLSAIFGSLTWNIPDYIFSLTGVSEAGGAVVALIVAGLVVAGTTFGARELLSRWKNVRPFARSKTQLDSITPESWKVRLQTVSPREQKSILLQSSHQTVGLDLAEFSALLNSVEGCVVSEPALSAYWIKRNEIESALHQQHELSNDLSDAESESQSPAASPEPDSEDRIGQQSRGVEPRNLLDVGGVSRSQEQLIETGGCAVICGTSGSGRSTFLRGLSDRLEASGWVVVSVRWANLTKSLDEDAPEATWIEVCRQASEAIGEDASDFDARQELLSERADLSDADRIAHWLHDKSPSSESTPLAILIDDIDEPEIFVPNGATGSDSGENSFSGTNRLLVATTTLNEAETASRGWKHHTLTDYSIEDVRCVIESQLVTEPLEHGIVTQHVYEWTHGHVRMTWQAARSLKARSGELAFPTDVDTICRDALVSHDNPDIAAAAELIRPCLRSVDFCNTLQSLVKSGDTDTGCTGEQKKLLEASGAFTIASNENVTFKNAAFSAWFDDRWIRKNRPAPVLKYAIVTCTFALPILFYWSYFVWLPLHYQEAIAAKHDATIDDIERSGEIDIDTLSLNEATAIAQDFAALPFHGERGMKSMAAFWDAKSLEVESDELRETAVMYCLQALSIDDTRERQTRLKELLGFDYPLLKHTFRASTDSMRTSTGFYFNRESCLTVDADGTTIGVSLGNRLYLADINDGRCIAPPLLHYGPVASANFSLNGERIVTLESGSATVRVWSAKTGDLLCRSRLAGREVLCADFDSSGDSIVAVTKQPSSIVTLSSEDLTIQSKHDGAHFIGAAIDSESNQVAVVTSRGDARVFASTGAELGGFLLQEFAVRSNPFNAETHKSLSLSRGQCCIGHGQNYWRFSVDSNAGEIPVQRAESSICGVASTATLVAILQKTRVEFLEQPSFSVPVSIGATSKETNYKSMAVSNNRNILVTLQERFSPHENEIRIWQLDNSSADIPDTDIQLGNFHETACFSPTANRVAWCDGPNSVRVRRMDRTSSDVQTIQSDLPVENISLPHSDDIILTVHPEGIIQVWQDQRVIGSFDAEMPVRQCGMSLDQQRVFAILESGEIEFWRIRDGKHFTELATDHKFLEFNWSGGRTPFFLATYQNEGDETFGLFDALTATRLIEINGNPWKRFTFDDLDTQSVICLSPNRKVAAVADVEHTPFGGSFGAEFRLIDDAGNASERLGNMANAPILAGAFSASGDHLLMSSRDRYFLFDVSEGILAPALQKAGYFKGRLASNSIVFDETDQVFRLLCSDSDSRLSVISVKRDTSSAVAATELQPETLPDRLGLTMDFGEDSGSLSPGAFVRSIQNFPAFVPSDQIQPHDTSGEPDTEEVVTELRKNIEAWSALFDDWFVKVCDRQVSPQEQTEIDQLVVSLVSDGDLVRALKLIAQFNCITDRFGMAYAELTEGLEYHKGRFESLSLAQLKTLFQFYFPQFHETGRLDSHVGEHQALEPNSAATHAARTLASEYMTAELYSEANTLFALLAGDLTSSDAFDDRIQSAICQIELGKSAQALTQLNLVIEQCSDSPDTVAFALIVRSAIWTSEDDEERAEGDIYQVFSMDGASDGSKANALLRHLNNLIKSGRHQELDLFLISSWQLRQR